MPDIIRKQLASVSKTISFALILLCLLNSCSSAGSPQILRESGSIENSNEPLKQKIADEPHGANVLPIENLALNTNQNAAAKIKKPYQARPQRAQIRFPEDCTDVTPAGAKPDYLSKACAEALDAARTDLEKAAAEGDCSSPIDAENNRSYAVVDDDKILAHTINNPDETDISVISAKLGTVLESFIKNNNLEYPIEFSVGQELKYQKAHYVYDFEPTFYPLSSNKYLVEIGCWTAAYNLSNIYLFYDESAIPAKAKVLEFPWVQPEAHIFDDFSDLRPPSDDYIAEYVKIIKEKTLCGFYFNRRTKTLIAYSKGNGMGKFGRYARYSFKKNGDPVLKEFRARFYDDMHNQDYPNYDYDDVIKSPPKTWKRYYPR